MQKVMKLLTIFFNILTIVYVTYSASVTEHFKTYENYKIYHAKGSEHLIKYLVTNMKKIENSLTFTGTTKEIQILVAPDLVPAFETLALVGDIDTKLVVNDFSKIIEEEKQQSLRSKDFWTSYHDVDVIYDYLKNMSKVYTKSTKLVVGGKSYEGRDILGLRINTSNDKIKPAVFIESGIHAREWIAPATTTYFINQLLTSDDPKIQELRDDFDWYIFPTVNPDGYQFSRVNDRFWRKTRSKSPNGCYGADPNRNWDYNWLQNGASSDPCDHESFGGTKPFSEIETRSLSEFISSIHNLEAYIAFHSDGQVLLLPYSDSVDHKDNYDDLVRFGKTSLEYGYKVNGAKYGGPATAAEILYKASGGSMDWVRHALGTRLVYAYELRGFNFCWPQEKIPEQGNEVTQMLLGLFTAARNMNYFNKSENM